MQFTYGVATFSDHGHVSYAYAYNALLDTHAQTVSPDWNYHNTVFFIYFFDIATTRGQFHTISVHLMPT